MTDADKCRVVSVTGCHPFSPVIVNFEFGASTISDTSKCEVYVDPENKTEKAVIVERNGKNFVGKISSDEISQTLILVRNRRTNKAKIYVAQSCNLIDSTREEESLKRKRQEDENPTEDTGYIQKEHSLRLSFGSKKAKRASAANMRLHMNVQTNKEDLQSAVSDINVKASEVNLSNQGEDGLLMLIPPCNRNGSRGEEVYRVEDILSNEEFESLIPAAEFLVNNSLTDVDAKNSLFLYSHYKLLGNDPDPKKIVLLIYASNLVRFFNMKAPDMRAKDVLQRISPQSQIIGKKILNEFTTSFNNIRTRPASYKDKIVCYIMVLILLACKLQVNIELLAPCLNGLGQKKLIRLARIVGLTPRKAGSPSYILKLPLPPLPKVMSPRKKK